MPAYHNQDRYSRAIRSEPSDTGLGCRCLASHTVPSEEFGQNSALFAVWTRVLGRDRTLRGDCVLQVRWDTKANTFGAMNEELMLFERPTGMLQVDAVAATRFDGSRT